MTDEANRKFARRKDMNPDLDSARPKEHWAWRQGTVTATGQHDDARRAEMEAAVRRELDFYLVELGEKDPFAYARYHCGTAANLYSRVHWSFHEGANTLMSARDLEAFVQAIPERVRHEHVWPAAPGSGESGHDQIAFAIFRWLPDGSKGLLQRPHRGV